MSDAGEAEPTVFKAVEALVKGIEIPLPPPHTFTDKDGHARSRVRVRWWDADAVTYHHMLSDVEREGLPELPIPEHARLGHDGKKPLFVGHYWLTGLPQILSETVACVDFSVAKGGKLVAYRWDGEPLLDASKFHWLDA